MPSFRRVSFSEKPDYSRLPRDDEMYVMKAFARHASHCSSCADPYKVYRAGGTLCPKGHQRALDVAQYVYTRAGLAYSLVDREKNQSMIIEIPAGCEPVRSLLKAMERGLRVMKRAPSASYDKTYFVPARPSSERRSSTKSLRLETAEPPPEPRPRPRRSRTGSYSSRSPSPTSVTPGLSRSRSSRSSRSPSPISIRPGLSRYGSVSSNGSSRNGSISSISSRGSSPSSRGSSRNSSISSMSSYGSSRNNSLSRDYPAKGAVYGSSPSSRDSYYKAPVYYRIKPEPAKSAPPVPPKDEYYYRRH